MKELIERIYYWIDTKWGCGAIWAESGVVIGTAPIFKKLKGETVEKLKKYYTLKRLGQD